MSNAFVTAFVHLC